MSATATASAPALKEIFNRDRLRHIAEHTQAVYPAFASKRFLTLASAGLDELSVMQRLARVSESLHATLPADLVSALAILQDLAPRLNSGFVSMCLPHYVASYGRDDLELSLLALKFFTTFGSSEFAIRHFLVQDQDRTLAQMREWATDDNEHVRRLASEGSRPRLPWSFRLPQLQGEPELAWPILEALNDDPSLYVRKSVANHLNDISKDHPDWLLERLENWPQDNPRTSWIIRHGLRSLIKQGDRRALALLGAGEPAEVELTALQVSPAKVRLGQSMTLSFTLKSTRNTPQRLVVDYAIDYVKASGKVARKVFKLKTLDLAPGALVVLSRSQQIRELTTRKHYYGHHAVHVLVNGERLDSSGFDLIP
ncbi:DNA alkylation repair protein [Pseudomonas sp. GV071]|uniref:DNA alkylation repair protein n=1 Tax=Pseudomonas sp. GV071 TaxID=2135754 RepID=UPI000D3B5085|nr:DNA alkylation repair protein [Pseudomonas sp. GV071]PTQ74230.1 3-methyladenine DNA glycosylase AlkC [Pseudomonas sp. GV071]